MDLPGILPVLPSQDYCVPLLQGSTEKLIYSISSGRLVASQLPLSAAPPPSVGERLQMAVSLSTALAAVSGLSVKELMLAFALPD